MKMISKKLSLGLAAALLTSLLSGNVYAALDYISEGLELRASAITMPRTVNGSLSVKKCAECDRLKLRVQEGVTRYVLKRGKQSENVSLQDFQAAMSRIGASDSQVMVFYAPDTKIVTEMRMSR